MLTLTMQTLCSTDDGVTPGVTVMEEDYKETPTEVGKSPRTKLNCLSLNMAINFSQTIKFSL